jgi:hypothetical protein
VENTTKLHRSSIGGSPILAEDQEWPLCKICNKKQALFFQFDITSEFNLPFEEGSHFAVFMCVDHSDIPSFNLEPTGKLPENYWQDPNAFYKIILNRPSKKENILDQDKYLMYSVLEFQEAEEEITEVGPEGKKFNIGIQEFKISGTPSWEQRPHHHHCSCGGEMKFICQVPADYEFEKAPDAPVKPIGYRDNTYMLFLGNEIYFFACEKQCNPLAVIAIV